MKKGPSSLGLVTVSLTHKGLNDIMTRIALG